MTKRNVYYQKWIERSDLVNNPQALFLFGDNTRRVGLGGQAKNMRGELNSLGIATKYLPSMTKSAFFTDDDYDKIVKIITKDLRKAFFWDGLIIIPADGLGTGLSDLSHKAPRVNAFLEESLSVLAAGGQLQWKRILNAWNE